LFTDLNSLHSSVCQIAELHWYSIAKFLEITIVLWYAIYYLVHKCCQIAATAALYNTSVAKCKQAAIFCNPLLTVVVLHSSTHAHAVANLDCPIKIRRLMFQLCILDLIHQVGTSSCCVKCAIHWLQGIRIHPLCFLVLCPYLLPLLANKNYWGIFAARHLLQGWITMSTRSQEERYV
jgi:hypothetical protein